MKYFNTQYRRYSGFILGAIDMYCLMSMYQDWLGKDAYVAAVQIGWWNTKWWAWLILSITLTASNAILSNRKRQDDKS